MKSLDELKALKEKSLSELNLENTQAQYRIVVGMATCGIAAGARPVMNSFVEEIDKRSVSNVLISMTGCIGMCKLEPIVEVIDTDGHKTTYVQMNAEKAVKILTDHIINGRAVSEYTIGAVEE